MREINKKRQKASDYEINQSFWEIQFLGLQGGIEGELGSVKDKKIKR